LTGTRSEFLVKTVQRWSEPLSAATRHSSILVPSRRRVHHRNHSSASLRTTLNPELSLVRTQQIQWIGFIAE